MPAPKPLTQCAPPQLDWSRPGTPAATDFGDIYFSVDGGLSESQAVFLSGCGLPQGWQDRSLYTIGELGFGSGLNFMAAWHMWENTPKASKHLHFVSVEKFPFSKDDLLSALSYWPELQDKAQRLAEIWPGRVRGFHRLNVTNGLTLTLIHDDVIPALRGLNAQVNAWFLDGFSPAKNPEMWTPEIMAQIVRLSAPASRLATFTVAGDVRNALQDVGFEVTKKEGFGRKRHRLEAILPATAPVQDETPRPVIIGGGIAGASLTRSFLRAGVTPTLINKDPDYRRAASGNPAALIKPRLDLQDRPEARFFLSSFLYARHIYRESGLVLSEGVTHLPTSDKDRARFEKLAAQAPLDTPHLTLQDGTLSLPSSLVIDPLASLKKWTQGATLKAATVTKLKKSDDGWAVFDGPTKVATGTHVIICAGADIGELNIEGLESLRFSRGQLSWARCKLRTPITYGGYALPLGNDILIGATHARLTQDDPYVLRPEDDDENLTKFRRVTGQDIQQSDRPGRASIRVTTPDTLPRVYEADQRWILTGLGSRGFVFAPLLADHIVSQIIGAPSPLDAAVTSRFAKPV